MDYVQVSQQTADPPRIPDQSGGYPQPVVVNSGITECYGVGKQGDPPGGYFWEADGDIGDTRSLDNNGKTEK